MSRPTILRTISSKAGSVDVMDHDIPREISPVGMDVLFAAALGIAISPVDSPSAKELLDSWQSIEGTRSTRVMP